MIKSYRYDAFISHAVEDKIAVANELYNRLVAADLKVWYSGRELSIGENLEAAIRNGLAESRYGVIIFSQHYISKTYTLKELLLFHNRKRRDVILPVLYQITIPELATRIPDVVGRFALTIEPDNMDHVVQAIVEKVRGKRKTSSPSFWRHKVALFRLIVLMVLAGSGAWGVQMWSLRGPSSALVQQEIQSRIEKLQHEVESSIQSEKVAGAVITSNSEVKSLYADYLRFDRNQRNYFEFNNGVVRSRAAYRVSKLLDTAVSDFSPANNYGFDSPKIYLLTQREHGVLIQVRYAYVNTKPVSYQIDSEVQIDDEYRVTVSYANNIRDFIVTLMFPMDENGIKSNNRIIEGHAPTETYIFQYSDDGNWQLKQIQ